MFTRDDALKYFFPLKDLGSKEHQKYIEFDNRGIRRLLISSLLILTILYPAHLLLDSRMGYLESGNFCFWFRISVGIFSILCGLFYYQYKSFNQTLYKLPFCILCIYIACMQSVYISFFEEATQFIPWFIIVVSSYLLRLTPGVSLIYGLVASVACYFVILNGSNPTINVAMLISNFIVIFSALLAISTRVSNNLKYFRSSNLVIEGQKKYIARKEGEISFLSTTCNQLMHDVKSPLMALNYAKNDQVKNQKLLNLAIDRVGGIIDNLGESMNAIKASSIGGADVGRGPEPLRFDLRLEWELSWSS